MDALVRVSVRVRVSVLVNLWVESMGQNNKKTKVT